ncbi:MAG TPA: hypothetical protein PKH77_28365 [Anaerolineae bacterium]|nr:hypothetical protein [Anaerolineae bacterium]
MNEEEIRKIAHAEAMAVLGRKTISEEEIRKIAHDQASKTCFSYFLIIVFSIAVAIAEHFLFP